MWTPRRIALLLTGLVISVGGYLGYSRLLGSFDGLPPLPADFRPDPFRAPPEPTESAVNSLEQKFELAFGVNCPELSSTYPIKLDLEGRGILVAAQEFKIQTEADPRPGWVRLSPLSLGMIGKKRVEKGIPEINTLYCDFAFLRFDKPIKSLSDMSGSKITMAELHADPDTKTFDARRGRIRGLNNRKTTDPNDDIELVAPGPLYYDADPPAGRPHIFSFTAIQVFDHQNTNLPVPDRTVPREPTVYGVGLRVYLTPEEKKPAGKGGAKGAVAKKAAPKKGEPKQSLSGVDVVELDNSVEMNLWTEEGASFVAPAGEKKKEPKPAAVVGKDGEPKKAGPPPEKRLLTVKTNGPFRYDLRAELAHFEKPPVPKPGIIEHVTVARANAGGKPGQDLLDCEFLDVQFQRTPPAAKGPTPREVGPAKTEAAAAPPPRKGPGDKTPADQGDFTIKSMRAWGETVVVQSDLENLHASGTEMTHDADKKLTVLKGDGVKKVNAVKDGNLLEGHEIHLFSTEGNELSQAQVLGEGSIGFGDIDPKTGTYLKTAVWTESMLYTKQVEKDRPPLDVLTFVGGPGKKAAFQDLSAGEPQQIEAHQLKVWLKAPDGAKGAPRKAQPKGDVTRSARPTRLEATGQVRSTAPELQIQQSDYLNVWFQDVPKLMKPPTEKHPAFVGPPAALAGAPAPKGKPADPKEPLPKDGVAAGAKGPAAKADPKAEPKKPLVVVARTIETWVNRDPHNQMELDRVHAEGDVDARQAAARAGDPDSRVAGQTVDMKAHAEGNELFVTGDEADPTGPKWGMVQNDQLTVYGFKINIDQRLNEAHVAGEGSMQMISASDLEGKKLEKPVPMTIYWKHKMDFRGTDRLIDYHGEVKGFQEGHRVRCEWMQVLLDRPVYLNQAMKPKEPEAPLPKVPDGFVGPPAPKKDEDRPKVDTVICVHLPKDDDTPRPKVPQPVLVVEEEKFQGKVIKFQSIQAPEVVTVNTPKDAKVVHELTATGTDTLPGIVRIWQPGRKDDQLTDDKAGPKKDGPKPPARGKGELGPDEEMKLTVVQFGQKMKAEDFRKRAKFWGDIRVVHLPADRPTLPVDLREGEIPKGAFYMACRDTLDVFTTPQKEMRDGKLADVSYQEMIGKGNVRVRKQGEFFGDADMVTYSELKGTLTFHGTERNPAVIFEQQGQGIRPKEYRGQTIKYYTKKKTFEVEKATTIGQ